jgi:hypothetical protein
MRRVELRAREAQSENVLTDVIVVSRNVWRVEILEVIADERRRLADLADSLTEEQLATRSLCDAWTAKEVVGHLLAVVTASNVTALKLLLTSAFNIRQGQRPARRTDRGSACRRTRRPSAPARHQPVPATNCRLSGGADRPAGSRPGHPPAARTAA